MTKAIRWTPDQLAAHLNRQRHPAPQVEQAPKKQPKYRNQKVEQDGITHDSRKEARRWAELQAMQEAGQISDLRRQVKFELIPSQRRADGKAERACSYVADFVYTKSGAQIVADAKGMKTKDYILKRKLMLYVHGITVLEV